MPYNYDPRMMKTGQVTWLEHRCYNCGDRASFGHNVDLLLALKTERNHYLGKWTCGINDCKKLTAKITLQSDLF